jgi:hypothetical protein
MGRRWGMGKHFRHLVVQAAENQQQQWRQQQQHLQQAYLVK